LQAVQQVAR